MKDPQPSIFAERFQECLEESRGVMLPARREEMQELYRASDAAYRQLAAHGADPALLEAYADARSGVEAYLHEALYHQGFTDCVYLLRWLGLF